MDSDKNKQQVTTLCNNMEKSTLYIYIDKKLLIMRGKLVVDIERR